MAKPTTTLEWCIVKLSDDLNWWVNEVSDTVHWDTDGLSIIDPRQVSHLIELVDQLRDYGFDPDIMDRAMITFRIDKDLGKKNIRLVRVKESIFDTEDQLFALPDILDDENSAYADFLDHITRLRVKLLNDLFDFEQRLSVDEVEEEIREENNADYMDGKATHLYDEITSVLEYVPAGWDTDEDDDDDGGEGKSSEEEFADVDVEVEEGDTKELEGDKSLRWDEDEEENEDAVSDYREGEEEGEGEDEAKTEEDASAKTNSK